MKKDFLAKKAAVQALLCSLGMCLLMAGCQNEAPEIDPAKPAQWQAIESLASQKGLFVMRLDTQSSKAPPLNQFHSWVIQLNDKSGQAVYPAAFSIGGGMPSHGHGLPSQPEITRYLGEGKYLLEGLKFNMAGDWLLRIKILSGDKQDSAEAEFYVDY